MVHYESLMHDIFHEQHSHNVKANVQTPRALMFDMRLSDSSVFIIMISTLYQSEQLACVSYCIFAFLF